MEEQLGTERLYSLMLIRDQLLSGGHFLLWALAASVALGLTSDALGRRDASMTFFSLQMS